MEFTAEIGDFVFIKQSTLEIYSKINTHVTRKNTRPNCLILKDAVREGIYWAVPLTSQSLDKYKERARKVPDRFKFYKFMGKENCFNISEMLPIIKSDIYNVYFANGKKVHIRQSDFNEINKLVMNIVSSPKRLSLVSQVDAPLLLMNAQTRYFQEKSRRQSKPRTVIFRPRTPKDRGRER